MACNSFATRILPIFCVIKSNKITLSSPRSWGCFTCWPRAFGTALVFPTLVGVFLWAFLWGWGVGSLPHARGGVSGIGSSYSMGVMSSPRSWGCFSISPSVMMSLSVFPTLVGVFPKGRFRPFTSLSLPHARGGVSFFHLQQTRGGGSSPRSWGCFLFVFGIDTALIVFPTLVGVFRMSKLNGANPKSLPHARGGVSQRYCPACAPDASSPRSWGCFHLQQPRDGLHLVFPTLVGVFLPAPPQAGLGPGLPHARGGVSPASYSARQSISSSPRSWGCFPLPLRPGLSAIVFPTLVGVFPK